MSAKEVVHAALTGEATGRAAALCPGGMMSAAVVEVMDRVGVHWPQAHTDARAMATLALAMQEATGFDNLALPFCMTVEAEAFGARVELGRGVQHPRVNQTILDPEGKTDLPRPDFRSGRSAVALEALSRVRAQRPDVTVMGNLVGPFTLVEMLAPAGQVLRWTRRRPESLQRHLTQATDGLIEWGLMQIDAGADVVCIAEPTATGEILGGETFGRFVLPQLQRLVKVLKDKGAGVIVHVCGDARPIERELERLDTDAISFDSVVNIVELGRENPPWRVCGNVDTFLLAQSTPERVRKVCERLVRGGVRLLAPACGLDPRTPVANLVALRDSAGET